MRRPEVLESPDDNSIGSSSRGENIHNNPELVVIILDLFGTDPDQVVSDAYKFVLDAHSSEYNLTTNFREFNSIDEFTKQLKKIPNQTAEQLAQAHLSVILNFPRPGSNKSENWLDLLFALSEVAKIEKRLKVATSDSSSPFIIPVIIATYDAQEVLARIRKTATKNPNALPICLKTKENAVISIIDQEKDRVSDVLFQRLAHFLPDTHSQRIPPFTERIENIPPFNSNHLE